MERFIDVLNDFKKVSKLRSNRFFFDTEGNGKKLTKGELDRIYWLGGQGAAEN